MDPSTTQTAIDLTPYLTDLLQLVGAIVVGLIGLASVYLQQRLKNDSVKTAMGNASVALQELVERAASTDTAQAIAHQHGWDSIQVKSQVLATAATMAPRFGDALKNAGITPDAVSERLIDALKAKLDPVLNAKAAMTTTTGTTAAATGAATGMPSTDQVVAIVKGSTPDDVVPPPVPAATGPGGFKSLSGKMIAMLATGMIASMMALTLTACGTSSPPAGTPVVNPTTGATEHVASQAQIVLAGTCHTFFGAKDTATGIEEPGTIDVATRLINDGTLKGTAATGVMVTALTLQGTCSDPNLLNALSDTQAQTDTARLNAAIATVTAANAGAK